MRTQDTHSARKGSSAPRTNSGDRTEPPSPEVDCHRARCVWADAVLTHPELQGKGRRNMQRVVMYMAMSVRYDPRLPNYGQCWPTVATLAAHCKLARRAVRRLLRRLEELEILTVVDRRPLSSLYTLHLGVDPWTYCYPAADRQQGNRTKTREIVLLQPDRNAGNCPIEPDRNAGNCPIEPIEQSLNQPEPDRNVGEVAAPSGSNGTLHSGAAQQALSEHGVGKQRKAKETREVRYLRNLHIHAKDVYEIALEHPDMSWRCMTTWGDEGGDIKGVLVERLRRIPEQAAAAQVKAQKTREEKRLKATQVAADDAALEAEEARGAALRQLNRERMAGLSGSHQAAARQRAIQRFRDEGTWRWLYDAYRVPIKRAAASGAEWDALPGSILPRRLEEYLALALDALDKGELAVLPQDGEPPVVMGLYGPVVGAVEQVEVPARNGRSPSPPPVEPVYVCEP